MKKILSLLFLCIVTVQAGEDLMSLQNSSGYYAWISVHTGTYLVLPSCSTYIPLEENVDENGYVFCHVGLSSSDFSNWIYDSDDYFRSSPNIILTNLFTLQTLGSFHESMLGPGFSLGLATAGAMLIFWIVRLLRKPVAES